MGRSITTVPFARRLDPYLLLCVLFSAIAALPLIGPYFVGSHDGVLAVYRFFQFDRSIQDGILIPRWAPDLFFGYGYPFFNFYAPFSYYVAEAFHTFGIGFVGSISATFALGFVLSGVFMYLFARDLGGPWTGTLAALAYVFAPYHLVNAHMRGDMAEFFGFVWFPAILWAAGRLVSRGSPGYLALTSLFYAALLTTHNIMALAFSPLLGAYMLFLLLRRRRVPGFGRRAALCLAAIVLAFGLSAFFWAPAIEQIGEAQLGRLANDPSFYYRTSLMQGATYLSSAILQGYGPRSPGGDYGYPVELGLVQVLLTLVAAGLLVWRCRKGDREGVSKPVFMAIAAVAFYAVMFPWALVLWEKLPLMSYVQSPWRLLPFLILCSSVLIGVLGRWAGSLRSGMGVGVLVLLALLVTVPNVINLQPRYVDLREDQVTRPGSLRFELLSQNLGMTAAGEYLPKGVRSKMSSSAIALDAISSGGAPSRYDPDFLAAGAEVDAQLTRTTISGFRVQSADGTPFLLNQTYFPGWAAYIDGQETPLKGVGTANLMSVQVPPGQHQLEFRFQDTRVRLLGEALSAASLLALVLVLLLALRQRRGKQPATTRHDQAQSSTIKHDQPLLLFGLLAVAIVLAAMLLVPKLTLSVAAGDAYPVVATWRGGESLLGYDLSASSLRPGQQLDLTLYWKGAPLEKEIRIGLKGRTGQVWPLAPGTPASPGPSGPPAPETRHLTVPADVPPGMYAVSLEVLADGKPAPLVAESLAQPVFPEKALLLGPVFVDRGVPLTEQQISIATRLNANLENKVTLLGYDLRLEGNSLDLKTHWKTLSAMRDDYAIMAHLMEADTDKVLKYGDLQPEGNLYPTTLWRPGEVVTVPFHFDLPADFDPAKYRLSLGMYTPGNFERLRVLDQAGNPYTTNVFVPVTSDPSGR